MHEVAGRPRALQEDARDHVPGDHVAGRRIGAADGVVRRLTQNADPVRAVRPRSRQRWCRSSCLVRGCRSRSDRCCPRRVPNQDAAAGHARDHVAGLGRRAADGVVRGPQVDHDTRDIRAGRRQGHVAAVYGHADEVTRDGLVFAFESDPFQRIARDEVAGVHDRAADGVRRSPRADNDAGDVGQGGRA